VHETVSAASVNALSFYSSNNQVKSQTVILKRHERTQVSENIGLDSIYIYICQKPDLPPRMSGLWMRGFGVMNLKAMRLKWEMVNGIFMGRKALARFNFKRHDRAL